MTFQAYFNFCGNSRIRRGVQVLSASKVLCIKFDQNFFHILRAIRVLTKAFGFALVVFSRSFYEVSFEHVLIQV